MRLEVVFPQTEIGSGGEWLAGDGTSDRPQQAF
jgi:hypothetical protein